jgi:hypothetical protein
MKKYVDGLVLALVGWVRKTGRKRSITMEG